MKVLELVSTCEGSTSKIIWLKRQSMEGHWCEGLAGFWTQVISALGCNWPFFCGHVPNQSAVRT